MVTEQYFNGMAVGSLHLAQSVTKSVVGTVAGMMIHRGDFEGKGFLHRAVADRISPSPTKDVATRKQVLDVQCEVVRLVHPHDLMVSLDLCKEPDIVRNGPSDAEFLDHPFEASRHRRTDASGTEVDKPTKSVG